MDTNAKGVTNIEIKDWDKFLESQEVMDYVKWVMSEMSEMGMNGLNVEKDIRLADMDLEMENDTTNHVLGYGDVDYTPATPGLSRKLGILELEDDECLCYSSCNRDHEKVQDNVEVDECLCSIRYDGVHEVEDEDAYLGGDLELEEGDHSTLEAHRGPGVGTSFGWKSSQGGTSIRDAVLGGNGARRMRGRNALHTRRKGKGER